MSSRAPQEFAPGIYRLLVGEGVLRANVYLVRAEASSATGAAKNTDAVSGTNPTADTDPADSTGSFAAARSRWTLVDTGVPGCDLEIRRVAETLFGPSSSPDSILVTHAHPDHVGSAAALARYWECPVYLHPEEVRMIGGDLDHFHKHSFTLDRWLILPILRLGGRRHIRAIMARDGLREFASALEDPVGASRATRDLLPVPGLPGWQALPTPGHTPGHLALFRQSDRVLISGDSVVTKPGPVESLLGKRTALSRSPWYFTWNRRLADASLLRLAELEPSVIAGGHGQPLRDAGLSAHLRALAARRQQIRRSGLESSTAPAMVATGSGPGSPRSCSPCSLRSRRPSPGRGVL